MEYYIKIKNIGNGYSQIRFNKLNGKTIKILSTTKDSKEAMINFLTEEYNKIEKKIDITDIMLSLEKKGTSKYNKIKKESDILYKYKLWLQEKI